MLDTIVFAEKYRPKKLEDCILPESIKSQVRGFLDSGNIPHILFSGGPGSGKTTLARVIVNEVDGEMLFINASLENGIDTIRTKVMQFSSTVSLEGKQKFILFDEFDGMSSNSQTALRGVIEEFKNIRFFFTCNHKSRIIEAIFSRTTTIDYDSFTEHKSKLQIDFFKRVCQILEKESIEFDKKSVADFIGKYFPDYRRILNELQRYSSGGKIDAGVLIDRSSGSIKELIQILKDKNFPEMRKWVGKNSDVDPQTVFKEIYKLSSDTMVPNCVPNVILILSDYGFKSTHSVDQEILMAAALTELMGTIQWKT